MKVREDIFPDLEGAEGLQGYLQGLANLAFEAFSGLFSSKDDVVRYINGFKSPDVAKRFLDISEYYYDVKFYRCPNCFPPTRLDKCPKCQNPFEMPSFVVLITIISIMEKLSRGLREYVDFFNWLTPKKAKSKFQSGEHVGKLVSNLKKEWREEYGSTTKITEFFKEFLTKREKIEFVKSIKFRMKVPELPPRGKGFKKLSADLEYNEWMQKYRKEIQKHNLESVDNIKKYVADNESKMTEEAVPICFDEEEYWNCYHWNSTGTNVGFCTYSYNCKLESDEAFLDECFKKTLKVVYYWRSQFVHDAKIPSITETAICSGVYRKSSDSPETKIVVLLTTHELKPVFERMVKKYFDRFQVPKKLEC